MIFRGKTMGLKLAMVGLAEYRRSAKAVSGANAAVKESMGDTAQGSKKLDLGMAALTGGMQALASQGIGIVLGGLKKLAAGLWEMIQQAGPVAGLKMSFEGLTRSMGVGSEEMLNSLRAATGGMAPMKDLMMGFNKAAQLVSRDFAMQLPDAMKSLGKVALATGQNMDYLMNSLIVGVGRMSPMILDNLAIQVKMSDGAARAAEMFGVEEKALTKAQEQMGLMNVVLEKLEQNTAGMPEVTGSAVAGMQSLGATIKDTKDLIGIEFLPIIGMVTAELGEWANVIFPKVVDMAHGAAQGIMGFITSMKTIIPFKAIMEGLKDAFVAVGDGVRTYIIPAFEIFGRWIAIIQAQIGGIVKMLTGDLAVSFSDLPDIIEQAFAVIGPVIQEVTKYLTYFFRIARDVFVGIQTMMKGDTEKATKFFTKAFNTALATVITLAKRTAATMVDWGKQMIASYSKGIIDGIKTYLSNALSAISSYLKSWMSPGSAPKFLPDIGTWGAGTMNEFLKGFGEADFGMLTQFTSQFKSELATLIDMGGLPTGQFADTFFELRGVLVNVQDEFAATGKIAKSALDPIRNTLGKTGEAMAELIEKNLEYTAIGKELADIADKFAEIDAEEQALLAATAPLFSQIAAGFEAVEAAEAAMDAALQPFINNMERLRAEESIALASLRERYEAGEIGLEEYEDRVKAAKEQTKTAKQALDLEKAAQIDARQTLATQRSQLELTQEQAEEAESGAIAELAARRAILQEEAQGIQDRAQAAGEEIAILEGRLAFHRETLEIMRQQEEMMQSIADAAKKAGKGEEEEEVLPDLAALIPDMAAALPTGDELRQLYEGMVPSGPAFDLGELLPDVEETKLQVAEWFGGAAEGIKTAMQNSPIAQWILDVLFVKLPLVVEGLRVWIEENFPDAYKAISTALKQAMAGDLPAALQTMVDYFTDVKEKITTWWTTDVKPVLDKLKLWWDTNWPLIQAVAVTAWTVIGDIIAAVVKTLKKTAWEPLKEALGNLTGMLESFGLDWGDVWEVVKKAVMIVAGIIGAILLALVGIIVGIVTGISKALANLIAGFTLIFAGIVDIVAGFMVFFTGVYEVIAGIFTLDFPRILNGLKMVWVGFWTFLQGLFGTILGLFRLWFGTISAFIGGFIEGFIAFFKNLYDELIGESIIPDLVKEMLTLFTDTFTDLLTGLGEWVADVIKWFTDLWTALTGPEGTIVKMGASIVETFVGAFEDVKTAIGLMWQDFVDLGSNLMAGIKQGIKDKIISLKNAIGSAVKAAVGGGEDAMESHSASQVFRRLAHSGAEGWELGWRDMIPSMKKQMQMDVMPAAIGPVAAAVNPSSINNVNQSRNFGDTNLVMPVTIVNGEGITLAQFQNKLQTVLGNRG